MGKTNGKTNDGFIDQSDAEQARHEALLPDGMRQELGIYIRLARTNYEKARTDLLAAFEKNPASAIDWHAEAMVKAQAEHEVWMRTEARMTSGDPREAMKTAIGEVAYAVRSFFGASSTSMFSNAVERAKAEAMVRLAETLEGLAKHFGI